MTPRAAPMAPDQRREALIAATVPLLTEHGRGVSTRRIAQAAGVAEGTIFRVFDSKDDLVEAAIMRAWDPGPFLDRVARIDTDQPLRDRLVDLVTLMQHRFVAIFGMMRAVGMVAPPERLEAHRGRDWRDRSDAEVEALIGADADQFRVPLADVVQRIRLLAFSASHAEIADGNLLTPEEIVDTLLFGLLRDKGRD